MAAKNDALWLKHFEEYKNFVYEESRFPPSNTKAGAWLHNQRVAYKGGFLPQERLDLLNAFNSVWCQSREELEEENKRLLLTSDWKNKVPEGQTTIDKVFEGEELYQCLKSGIYSCEMYFEQKWFGFDYSETKIKVFETLFPNLDYSCTNLLAHVYGVWPSNALEFMQELSGAIVPVDRRFPNSFKSKEDMRSKIDNALNTLAPREKTVMILRHGLKGYGGVADGTPKTIEDISKKFDLTRERVRQIEAKALRRLRHPFRRQVIFFTKEELEAQEREEVLWRAKAYTTQIKDLTDKWGLNIDYTVFVKPINECNFSVRTFNHLHRAGFRTVADLLNKVKGAQIDEPFGFLQEVEHLGSQGAEEVINFLSPYVDLIQKAKEKELGDIGVVLHTKPYTLLEDAGFTVRSFNCLKRAGFNTIEDIIAKTDFDADDPFAFLHRVRNFGQRCFDEVVDYIVACEKYQVLLREKNSMNSALEVEEPLKCDKSSLDNLIETAQGEVGRDSGKGGYSMDKGKDKNTGR